MVVVGSGNVHFVALYVLVCCAYLSPKRIGSCKHIIYTGYTKEWCGFKSEQEIISHLTWAQRTPSAAATVQVSHALPAGRFSCLLRGQFPRWRRTGKGFLCAPFWGVQI